MVDWNALIDDAVEQARQDHAESERKSWEREMWRVEQHSRLDDFGQVLAQRLKSEGVATLPCFTEVDWQPGAAVIAEVWMMLHPCLALVEDGKWFSILRLLPTRDYKGDSIHPSTNEIPAQALIGLDARRGRFVFYDDRLLSHKAALTRKTIEPTDSPFHRHFKAAPKILVQNDEHILVQEVSADPDNDEVREDDFPTLIVKSVGERIERSQRDAKSDRLYDMFSSVRLY